MQNAEQAKGQNAAGTVQVLIFAVFWLVPLGALVAFAAIETLWAGASSIFRYVGF